MEMYPAWFIKKVILPSIYIAQGIGSLAVMVHSLSPHFPLYLDIEP